MPLTKINHDHLLNTVIQHLNRKEQQIMFLQIGAMDGKSFDPLYPVVRTNQWQGILVEPLPDHFEQLKKNYAGRTGLQFVNAAIDATSGRKIFYRIDAQAAALPDWVHGISSFSREHLANHECWHAGISHYIVATDVATITMFDLLKRHGFPRIDLLQIDAEGHDYQILRQWDFAWHRPLVINVEFVRLTPKEQYELTMLLLRQHYLLAAHGLDLMAIRPELVMCGLLNA